jgi:flagellar hook-associated protein 2
MMDVQTQMRLTGLASGLDTDLIIQNLGKVHTVRIDAVKRDRQLALWRQEAYRNTISLLQNFTKSSFNAANPTSNFRSASAFAKFSYNLSVGGAAGDAAKTAAARVLSVTANGDLKNFNQSVQAVAQLASKDTWSGKDMGLRGVKSSGFNVNNFVQRHPNGSSTIAAAYFGLSIDGVSRTIQIDPDKVREIISNPTLSQYNQVAGDNGYKTADGVSINFEDTDFPFEVNLQNYSIEVDGEKVSALTVFMDIAKAFTDAGLSSTDAFDYFRGNENGDPNVSIDPNGKIIFNNEPPQAVLDAIANGGKGELSGLTAAELTDAITNGIQLYEPDYAGVDLGETYVVSTSGKFVTMKQELANRFGISASALDVIDFDSPSVYDDIAQLLVGAGRWDDFDSAKDATKNTLAFIGSLQRYEKNETYDANATAKAFANLINDEVKKQFGSDYAGLVTADASGELVFNKTGSTVTLFDSFGGSTQLGPLGFPSGGASSNTVYSKKLNELFDPAFFQEKDSEGNIVSTSRTIQVNGKSIVLAPTDTITEMMTKINNSGAGMNLSYNTASDKFTLTSTQEGTANNVADVRDAAAQFFSFLGLGQAVEVERDVVTIGTNGMPVQSTVQGYRLVTGGELDNEFLESNERFVIRDADGEKIGMIKMDDSGRFVHTDAAGNNPQTYTDNEINQVKGLLDISGDVGSRTKGTNLIAQINGEVFVRQSNTFQYEGMTYTFTSTYGIDSTAPSAYNVIQDANQNEIITINRDPSVDEIKIDVGKNTAELIDSIKAFVEEYNSILDHLNGLLNGKRDRDYQPLTDDEKKAMKDDDIKAYEEKAKVGIMSNADGLRKLLNDLRSAIYQRVEGVGLTMSEIGITTGSNWKEGGRLMIDEDKLRNALENRYDEVVTLFTKADTGVAQRLNKVLSDASRTTTFDVDGTSVGTKGYLIEKAGAVNDASQFNNAIQKQITTYDEKINLLLERWNRQENTYYAMFARMETAMAKMQAQQNSLASLMAQQGK